MSRGLARASLASLAFLTATACGSGGGTRAVERGTAPPESTARATGGSTQATDGDTGTTADGDQVEPIEWRSCGNGAECGSLDVPLDPESPSGETITLAVARHAAGGDRVGTLLVNPGGPGASGLMLATEAESIFPAEILDRFDVVGWDPRGVGESTAVDCLDDLDPFWAADRSPDDAGELAEVEAVSKELADSCRDRSGALLEHVSSLDTVSDMDSIRQALGEEQISYLGYSYGTYLGALYADANPDRVRAMVLDGAVDPALDPVAVTRQQAVGFDDALHAFFEDCAGDDGCAFHSGGDPASAYDRLMEMIDAETLPAEVYGEERSLGPGEADIGVATALYGGRDGWPVLAEALSDAARGDGSLLLELSDAYTGRTGSGTYDNENEAFFATACIDSPPPTGASGFEQLAEDLNADAPHFGATTLWLGLPCAFWPVEPVSAPAEIHAVGAPPILVLGTGNDPATPLAWAESLAGQLETGILVVFDGEGHTAFGRGSDCIDDAVVGYLVELDVPTVGTRCEG